MAEKCACYSADAHNCWALRYHGHTGVSELTVNAEGGPCECFCHEVEDDADAFGSDVKGAKDGV
jgi:hypothetical protein